MQRSLLIICLWVLGSAICAAEPTLTRESITEAEGSELVNDFLVPIYNTDFDLKKDTLVLEDLSHFKDKDLLASLVKNLEKSLFFLLDLDVPTSDLDIDFNTNYIGSMHRISHTISTAISFVNKGYKKRHEIHIKLLKYNSNEESVLNELYSLRSLNGMESGLKFIGYYFDTRIAGKEYVYIFTQLASVAFSSDNASLFQYIKLAEGLKKLHDRGYIHNDIKPDNIRIEDTSLEDPFEDLSMEHKNQPIFIDYGCMSPYKENYLTADCLTPLYASPEHMLMIYSNSSEDYKEYDAKKSDIYELGLSLVHNECRHYAYIGLEGCWKVKKLMELDEDDEEFNQKVYDIKMTLSRYNPPGLLGELFDIIDPDPAKRPNLQEIIEKLNTFL